MRPARSFGNEDEGLSTDAVLCNEYRAVKLIGDAFASSLPKNPDERNVMFEKVFNSTKADEGAASMAIAIL
jgi:hypothetical protein